MSIIIVGALGLALLASALATLTHWLLSRLIGAPAWLPLFGFGLVLVWVTLIGPHLNIHIGT